MSIRSDVVDAVCESLNSDSAWLPLCTWGTSKSVLIMATSRKWSLL